MLFNNFENFYIKATLIFQHQTEDNQKCLKFYLTNWKYFRSDLIAEEHSLLSDCVVTTSSNVFDNDGEKNAYLNETPGKMPKIGMIGSKDCSACKALAIMMLDSQYSGRFCIIAIILKNFLITIIVGKG